jgi:hypothetical protein
MDELETIEGIGEVVRVQDSPRGMGVVFVTLTHHSQALIGKLITARRKGQTKGKPPPPPAAALRQARPPTGETVTRQVFLEPENEIEEAEPVIISPKKPPPPPKKGKS